MNKTAIKKYVDVIRRACDLIEEAMGVEDLEAVLEEIRPKVAKTQVIPTALPEPEDTTPVVQKALRDKHIADLMAIDCWPEAVQNFHLVTSDSQRIDKANAILDSMFKGSLEGSHFLDFGCGEGWLARQARKRGTATTTGFDIVSNERWSEFSEVQYFDDYSKLVPSKYDVIFLYDVLDHCADPLAIMEQVKSLLAPNGKVYIRCHPWTSRHASHLPQKGLNKAFIHLFLTWEELKEIGFEPMFTRIELDPLEAYRWWLHDFNIESERRIPLGPLHEFFKVPSFQELIIQEQDIPKERVEGFFKDMEVNFFDFIISHKDK